MAKKSGNRTIAEEYIISIIPEIDQKKFDKARERVGELIKQKTQNKKKSEYQLEKERIKLSGIADREKVKTQKEILKLSKEQIKLEKEKYKYNKFLNSESMAEIMAMIGSIAAVFTLAYEVAQKMSKMASNFSNSMITAGSAFVNRDTRQLMATFGVSGQQATGMQSVMDLMGINTSDFKMMTPAQMQLYTRLMAQWQAGMESIGQSDLQKFQETMQSMQSEMASAKLELQIELYRLLVSMAPEIKEFFSSIISLVKTLGELMNSPLVKTILSTLSALISGVVRIVSALGQVLSFDFVGAYNALAGNDVGGSNNTTNYYSISTNSTNNFSGDTSSMYAIATQTQQDEINSIATTIHSTGGA